MSDGRKELSWASAQCPAPQVNLCRRLEGTKSIASMGATSLAQMSAMGCAAMQSWSSEMPKSSNLFSFFMHWNRFTALTHPRLPPLPSPQQTRRFMAKKGILRTRDTRVPSAGFVCPWHSTNQRDMDMSACPVDLGKAWAGIPARTQRDEEEWLEKTGNGLCWSFQPHWRCLGGVRTQELFRPSCLSCFPSHTLNPHRNN